MRTVRPSGTERPWPQPSPSRPLKGRLSDRQACPCRTALALAEEAAVRLWKPEGTEALAYLRGRGLTDETIQTAKLGFTPSVMVPTRDGDQYYRARGIVIPWFDGDRLAKVKIRQPEGSKPKYAEAFRHRPRLYPGPGAIEIGRPLVLVEGEFDALLLGQELRGLAAVVTLGSASVKRDSIHPTPLFRASRCFVALDGDEAGDRAASEWPPHAARVPPPEGKDWTDSHQAGVNLRLFWTSRLAPSAQEGA